MDFKNRILAALRAGRRDEDLLGIVRDSQPQFSNIRAVYDALEQIWQEMGFDERSDGGAIQDSLEFVMEKLWYECPASESRN